MDKFVEKYFPDGCPVCGHSIELEKKLFKYICYNCNAHADCHGLDGETFKKYEPSERLASNEEHNLRKTVRKGFSKLFLERRDITGNHDTFQTSLINIVFPYHLVKRVIKGKEYFFQVSNKNGDQYTLVDMDSGKIETVSKETVQPVTNREKSMVFLSTSMGLETKKARIGFLDHEELLKANTIIHKAIQDARKNSLEHL